MGGTIPPGVSAFNWLRQKQIAQVTTASGLQLTNLQPSSPSKICGSQLDSSVNVNGLGGIPITPNTITPDMVQGHAFVAPTYSDSAIGLNLIMPQKSSDLNYWTKLDGKVPIATYLNTSYLTINTAFNLVSGQGQATNSVIYQRVKGLLPGAFIVISGMIALDYMGTLGCGAYIAAADSSGNVLAIQQIGGQSTNPILVATYQQTFHVPNDGIIDYRCGIGNNLFGEEFNGGISAYFTQMKLEYGVQATNYFLNSNTPVSNVTISGALQSVQVFADLTNIPMNAVRVLWLFKNAIDYSFPDNLLSSWTPWAETSIPGVPYPEQAQNLSFTYGQLAFGVTYDFGCAYVDLQGNVGTPSAFCNKNNPSNDQFHISSSYMKTFGGTFIPAIGTPVTLSTPLSANGITSSVEVDFTIINQPLDGSLSRVSLWFRKTPQAGAETPNVSPYAYTFYGSIPATGVGLGYSQLNAVGTYSFVFADLSNGMEYDFGITCEDASGGDTALVYLATAIVQLLALAASALPSAPAGAYINVTAPPAPAQLSIQVAAPGQPSYYIQISPVITVTQGVGGAIIDTSSWLASINILSKPLANATPDYDPHPADYTISNTIAVNQFQNPLVVTIGPFPGGQDQEIAIQLVDQAGNASNSDAFVVAQPPTQPVYDSNGKLQYISYGKEITDVITSNGGDGNLAAATVAREQIATPATGNNLLFNPTAAMGTQYWIQADGFANHPFITSETYNGGRFKMTYPGGGNQDTAFYQQLSNIQPSLNMVLSGVIEIDILSGINSYAGIDIFEPISGTLITSSYYTLGSNGQIISRNGVYTLYKTDYFELPFIVPPGGDFQVRMRLGNNASGGGGTVYFYKLQCEHGTIASPYNDASAAAAVTNTHTPAGQLIMASDKIDGGTIDYNASPSQVTDVINNTQPTGTYNAGTALPVAQGGSTVPYTSVNGAYQIAIGPNSQMQNGQLMTIQIPALPNLNNGVTTVFYGIAVNLPNAGIWQVVLNMTVIAFNCNIMITTGIRTLEVFGRAGSTPATPGGITNVINMNTPIHITGLATLVLTASFQCSGSQSIGLNAFIGGDGSATSYTQGVGSLSYQSIQIA